MSKGPTSTATLRCRVQDVRFRFVILGSGFVLKKRLRNIGCGGTRGVGAIEEQNVLGRQAEPCFRESDFCKTSVASIHNGRASRGL